MKRRKKSNEKNYYFNADTQAGISEYQQSKETPVRHKVYTEKILPAFDKLVENLIFIHGFSSPSETYDELKSDCITFLYETLQKFDRDRGTKAFSYFNVVAKNWLIIRTRQRTSKSRKTVSINDVSSMTNAEYESLESHDVIPEHDEVMIYKHEMSKMRGMLDEIKNRSSSTNDVSCIESVITLFEQKDDIELLNKKAVFLYIREMTGLTPKQLTTAISNIKKHYKSIRKENENAD